jgi:predicted phage-related endonuclease
VIESAAPSAPTLPHASYLGGSDIAAILGIDPFRSALSVWGEKTGRLTGTTSPAMEAGNDFEGAIVAGYRRRVLGARVGALSGVAELVSYPGPGTLRSSRDPWRAATPDALAILRRRGGAVAQAKLVGFGMSREWGAEEDGPDGVPAHVHAQVHWETLHAREALGIAGEVAHVVAAIGTELRVYELEIDDAMISDLLDAGRDFWKRHVERGEMPIVTEKDRDQLVELFPRAREPLAEPSEDALELIQRFDAARAIAKAADVTKETIAAQLCALIGDREGFSGKWGRAVWREQSRARTDWKAIAEQLGATPELIAKATTTTACRVLDVRLKG